MNAFPPEKLDRLLNDLERHRPKGRAVAAFDADGTLWSCDMGEALFGYTVDNKLVDLPPDPWGHYAHLKTAVSHPVAYLWLAQIYRGVPLAQVRRWADEAVAAMKIPVFEAQRKVLAKLKDLEVETYVVTASIKWAVEPAARAIGLSDAQVIGIETEVVDGHVTDRQRGVITYREGKIEALRAQTAGTSPYFASGNTEGDRWLLEGATDLRLVMASANEDEENRKTEQIMLDLAAERGWYFHRY